MTYNDISIKLGGKLGQTWQIFIIISKCLCCSPHFINYANKPAHIHNYNYPTTYTDVEKYSPLSNI